MMLMLDIYAENILEHYKNPHNHYAMRDPDLQAHDSNPVCGDEITIYLKMNGNNLASASFTGRGCAISQASASMLTDSIKGKSRKQMLSLNKDHMLK
ncbi:SUF system NifU family Fe-S cluster assembly protein, partial [archaeon]|nr:SUF system NifU family Fe-S cluster assembly protein [archaeon]